MKAKLASLTCGCNSLKVLALRIMARRVWIPSISYSIRTPTSAGFLLCHGLASEVPTTRKPAISGTQSSPRTQIRWFLIFSCPIQRWRTRLTSAETRFARSLIPEQKPLSRSRGRGRMYKAERLAWMGFSTLSNRSPISRTSQRTARIRPQFCSSIALSLPRNCGRSTFHSSRQSIQSLVGQSGGSVFATALKHGAMIRRAPGLNSIVSST